MEPQWYIIMSTFIIVYHNHTLAIYIHVIMSIFKVYIILLIVYLSGLIMEPQSHQLSNYGIFQYNAYTEWLFLLAQK